MSAARFSERLRHRALHTGSWVCVGLDPDPGKLPEGFSHGPAGIEAFLLEIIAATADHAAAFKPNSAFFEQFGIAGLRVLERVREAIPDKIPMILDCKRGDIGSTAQAYARAAFDAFGADAVTVNPYMGADTLEPWLEWTGRGVFVLCMTSNPGAADLQEKHQLHRDVIAMLESTAGSNEDVGLVVGATRPERLAEVRQLAPSRLFLVPGIGAQGGDVLATVRAGASERGVSMLVNASRSILYASTGSDFAGAARAETQRLKEAIRHAADA